MNTPKTGHLKTSFSSKGGDNCITNTILTLAMRKLSFCQPSTDTTEHNFVAFSRSVSVLTGIGVIVALMMLPGTSLHITPRSEQRGVDTVL